jgi:hypothetical protein
LLTSREPYAGAALTAKTASFPQPKKQQEKARVAIPLRV